MPLKTLVSRGCLLLVAAAVASQAATTGALADQGNPEPRRLAAASTGGGLVADITSAPIRATLLGGPTLVPDTLAARAARVAGSSTRLAGTDRYRTAVAVSRSVAPQGAAEVVLASGADFPDALSAAPLASHLGGPLLLTAPTALPAVVAAELDRLNPRRITVIGGEGAVSSATAAAARAASGGSAVGLRRLAGSDRYLTSALVAGQFSPGAPGVVLASGAAFPDGVSAGPVAAALKGPVLLTAPFALPAATRTALGRLAPQRLVIAGGRGAVGGTTETAAESATHQVAERAAGVDRYHTSSALAALLPPIRQAHGAFLATGSAFADALVGGVGAAAQGGPVLLTGGMKGALGAVAADLARARRVGTWLQLSLDFLAKQQGAPATVYVAYDAAYQAASVATLYGWQEPEALAQLQRLRSVRKPGGGYGIERTWDAFGDGSVNPASTSYLVSVTDHAGLGLLAGLRAGAVPASEVRALVDLVMAWPRVDGDDSCLAYSTAATDHRWCVYNVNSSAAWFLRAAYDAGVQRPGQRELAETLYHHDVVLAKDGWWPYSSNRPTQLQDWNHNAAMVDFQFQLEPVAGQESLDHVMPNGWVHPDPRLATSSDVMGYMRLLPYACGYRGTVPDAATTLASTQTEASILGQLALWSVRTTASCGPA